MDRRALVGVVVTTSALVATLVAPAHADPAPGGGDTTPPQIAISIPASPGEGPWAGWYADPVLVTVSATDAAGIAGIGYRLTGAQTGEETGSEPLSFTITEPGVTTITVTADDVNGNQARRTYGVGIDATDPIIEVSGTVLDGRTIRQGDDRRLTYECADAATGVASCTASDGVVSAGRVPTGSLGDQRITITALDHVGRTRTRHVDYTVEPALLRIINPPVIDGDPDAAQVGQVLTATAGTFDPAAERVTYEWLRTGTAAGTGPTYTPTAADVGHHLSLRATAHRAGYADTKVPWTTGWVLIEPGEFDVSGSPAATGAARVGGTLRISPPTTIEPQPAIITNLWLIDGEPHETDSPRLELTAEHVGKTIGCVQEYSRPGYVDVTRSCVFPDGGTSVTVEGPDPGGPGSPDGAGDWAVLTPAGVTGRPKVGRKLRAVLPRLSAPAQRWRYRWLRNGKAIKGAVRPAYKLRKADRGRRIAIRVTATGRDGAVIVSVSPARKVRR